MQVVAPPEVFRLPFSDLGKLPETIRQERLEQLLRDDVAAPFDLERGPLYRAHLVRLSELEHVLIQSMHHIVFDGWSIGIFFRELAALLEARPGSSSPGSPLAELPIQYPDFALWQRRRLRGARLESELDYWRTKLGGQLPTPDLPTDWQRPAVQRHRGARVERFLPGPLASRLKTFSQGEGASLFMTLLAAFKVLLHRLTGEDDILVGAPVAGRRRVELEGLVGFFLNTLVLRSQVRSSTVFRELLRGLRETVLEAMQHQDVPFEKLLEELRPERRLSHSPFFQVFFNMVNLPGYRFELPGLEVESLDAAEVSSKFDLTLYVRDTDGELELDLVYDADLFRASRMAELTAQLTGLLEQIVDDPEQEVGHLSLLTKSAAAILPCPSEPLSDAWEGSIHAGFARQAARRPEAPAVIDSAETWSYGELDVRANQLAHYLIAGGVGLGDAVAVYAHRNASLVWALVGVLKAGAAFVILDPAYPPARLAAYVCLARPRGFVEVDGAGEPPAELVGELDRYVRCRLRLPTRSAAEVSGFLADQPGSDPAVPLGPDDTAYIAFTSGSIGEPKGILGRHGPLTHYLPWLGKTFELKRRGSPQPAFSAFARSTAARRPHAAVVRRHVVCP